MVYDACIVVDLEEMMKIAAFQMAGGNVYAQNVAKCRQAVEEAAADGARVLVLPEAAMFLRSDEAEATMTQPLDGEFVGLLQDWSQEFGLLIVAGMFEPAADGRAFNTVVAVDKGHLLASYRKLHLYDAFAVQESQRIASGEALPPVVDCDGVKIGLMTCYDVRFPEVARALALQGAEVIALPAAWFAGEYKLQHWRLLCAARALENGVYVLGAGMCGGNRIGHSLWADALGNIQAELGEAEGLLCAEVDLAHLQAVRARLPLLEQRRFGIVWRE